MVSSPRTAVGATLVRGRVKLQRAEVVKEPAQRGRALRLQRRRVVLRDLLVDDDASP